MLQVQTQQFGLLEIDPAAHIEFPLGLPGFENEHGFVLVERTALAPVIFLQSLTSPGLCFTALPIAVIDANYDLQLNPEDLAALGWSGEGDTNLLPLAVLSAVEDGCLTANLLAPVVVDLTKRVGVQAVRWDTKYSHAHPLGEVGGEEVACS